MTEVWKDVLGFEGFYQVSNLGRVRRLRRSVPCRGGSTRVVNDRILSAVDAGKGYRTVMLSANGKRATPRLCRLVATAFVENPFGYTQVNHKDEDKTNDRAENLEWCTPKYNTNYGTGIRRRAMKISKPVSQYDLNGNFIRDWDSIKNAEQCLGIDNSHISRCCHGKLHQTGGYIWKYKN